MTSRLPLFLLGEKALGKRLPKVRLEILKRERLGINVYGLSAMYSGLYIVGSFMRVLSEKSQDTSRGGGNEAQERLNNWLILQLVRASWVICGPQCKMKMWDSLFKKQEKAFTFL